jgi:hypothetical protein
MQYKIKVHVQIKIIAQLKPDNQISFYYMLNSAFFTQVFTGLLFIILIYVYNPFVAGGPCRET